LMPFGALPREGGGEHECALIRRRVIPKGPFFDPVVLDLSAC